MTGLTGLQTLDLSHNQIAFLKEETIEKNLPFTYLSLGGNPIINIPKAIYEQSNCLADLKNFFADLKKGATTNNEVKLILIGNGSVGKSQIARRLQLDEDFTFDEEHHSTHGVVMSGKILKVNKDPELEELKLNIWDFAGQDIYHATHRMLIQTSALFLLAWDLENENQSHHTHQGKKFNNEKLTYWLEYVKCFSPGSPVLVLQNKVDESPDKAGLPASIKKELIKINRDIDFLQISAKTGFNFAELKRKTGDVFIQNKRLKTEVIKKIPQPWADVRNKVTEAIANEVKKIELGTFDRWCQEADIGDSSVTLLRFLHDTGVLFYREGYFQNDIILDQSWAFEAVYAVLDRSPGSYFSQLYRHGTLLYTDLIKIWSKHSDQERKLFIDFMISCELCFETTANNTYHRPLSERSFVVPELLSPEKPEDVIYDELNMPRFLEVEYQFLPRVFIQRFLVKAKAYAKVENMWQAGALLGFENEWAVVEAHYESNPKKITIKTTKGGESLETAILEELKEIEQEGNVKAKKTGSSFDVDAAMENYFGFLKMERSANSQKSSSTLGKTTKGKNLKVFISYAHEDADLKSTFDKRYLSPMIEHYEGEVKFWSDKEIKPATSWDKVIKDEIHSSDAIIFFLSNAFLSSEYISKVERDLAMERYSKKQQIIIPVYIETISKRLLPFSDKQYLPNGTPLKNWQDQNEAWVKIQDGLFAIIDDLLAGNTDHYYD